MTLAHNRDDLTDEKRDETHASTSKGVVENVLG